jgi:RDD family protein
MDDETPDGPIRTPPWESPPPRPGPSASPSPGAPGPTGPIVNWAPPPAAPEVPGAPGLSFADTASRIVAYVIDIAILGIIGFVIAALLGLGEATTRTSGSNTFSSYFVSTTNPIVSLIFAVIGAAYFILSWSGGRRATIGQRLLHLQVGNAFDGLPLSTEQALRRWIGLGSFLGLLAFIRPIAGLASLAQLIWIVVLVITTVRSPTKQGLHDRFANSAVVKPSGEGTSGLAMACLLVIGLIVVLAIIGIIAAVMMGPAFFDQLSRLGRSV